MPILFLILIKHLVLHTIKRYIACVAESISNASGLGFNGYDKHGLARWDLVKTMDPLSLEFGTNVRQQVQAWNVQTATWLRRYQDCFVRCHL